MKGGYIDMTVSEFISKLGLVIGKSADKIIGAIMKADLISLIKFGTVIGASIATVYMIFRYFKMRKKVYSDKKTKDAVDDGLDLNYADVRKQDKLNPLMKKVRKNLTKHLKPRYKKTAGKSKKVSKERAKYQKYIKDLKIPKEDKIDEEDYDFQEDFEMFRREMKDVDKQRDEERKNPKYDPYKLRNVWEYC